MVVPRDGHEEAAACSETRPGGEGRCGRRESARFGKQGAYALPVEEGSATQQPAAILPRSRVLGAFRHVSAVLLEDDGVTGVDTDVLVRGDDRGATHLVQRLVDLMSGMRGVFAGRLPKARDVEALTVNLISINRLYTAHADVRVTDV